MERAYGTRRVSSSRSYLDVFHSLLRQAFEQGRCNRQSQIASVVFSASKGRQLCVTSDIGRDLENGEAVGERVMGRV